MPASFVLSNVIIAGNKTDKNLSLLMSKERQEYNWLDGDNYFGDQTACE